ncbi:MAG TPA: dienelactone hydrolase family protein [Methylomirabilota bacterium]|nr:dienelactone hydrolase family protein [Methylomirabilota bacterium]
MGGVLSGSRARADGRPAAPVGCSVALPPASETVRFPGDPRTGRAPAELEAVLLRPSGPGPFPALVMLHGCSGLRTRGGAIQGKLRFWAEHFRDRGYVALLVDSFTPRGVDEVCTGRHLLSPVRERADDARGGLRYLQARPDVLPDRVGLVGWSNGAAATLSVLFDTGSRDRDFRAAVAFYPNCTRQYPGGPEFRPYAPLYILAGALDDWTPPRPCVALVEAARARGAPIAIKLYPGAHHGFDAPGMALRFRPEVRNHSRADGDRGATMGTDPAARADAIAEVTRFFASELGGD